MMEIVPALTGMRTAIALAVDAIAARDHVKAQEAIGELSRRLADANMGALDMSEHLRKIEAQLRETESKLRAAEERLGQREKYVLRAVAPGVFVRAYEPVSDDPTPPHYQCQICFDAQQQSVLSLTTNGNILQCRVDPKHSVRIANNVPRAHTPRIAGWQG